MHNTTPKTKSVRVGGDRKDFELELDVVPVKVHRTRKDRIVDAIWTMSTTIIAVTLAQTIIIPLFS